MPFIEKIRLSIKKRGFRGFLSASIKHVRDSVWVRVLEIYNLFSFFTFRVSHGQSFFTYQGLRLTHFVHPYNRTWENERSLEIPIVTSWLGAKRGESVLELGNVMSHYISFPHVIVDKYEQGIAVVNKDIIDFQFSRPFEMIFSISTIEHVGYDCGEPFDPDKPLQAIKKMYSLLSDHGEMLLTFPIGYNPSIDDLILQRKFDFTRIYFWGNDGVSLQWRQLTESLDRIVSNARKGRKTVCVCVVQKI